MKARHPRPRTRFELAQDGFELVGVKTELAVEMPCTNVFVRMALDSGSEAQHQAGWSLACGHQHSQTIEIMLVVGNDHHVVAIGQQQLFVGFVVAVQNDPLSRHSAIQRRQQLTGRNGIKTKTFRSRNGTHGQGTVGLGGINGKRRGWVVTLKGCAIGAAGSTDPRFIQDIERCAIALGEIAEATTTHFEATLLIQRRSDRSQVAIRTQRVTAGLEKLGHGAEAARRPM